MKKSGTFTNASSTASSCAADQIGQLQASGKTPCYGFHHVETESGVKVQQILNEMVLGLGLQQYEEMRLVASSGNVQQFIGKVKSHYEGREEFLASRVEQSRALAMDACEKCAKINETKEKELRKLKAENDLLKATMARDPSAAQSAAAVLSGPIIEQAEARPRDPRRAAFALGQGSTTRGVPHAFAKTTSSIISKNQKK